MPSMEKIERNRAIRQKVASGRSYASVGAEYGISRQRVGKIYGSHRFRCEALETIIYPNLRNWMLKHEMCISNLSKIIGVRTGGSETLYTDLRGEHSMPYERIVKILEVTGMTFEECFEIEEGLKEVKGVYEKDNIEMVRRELARTGRTFAETMGVR
jgi:ribosomal protein L20A (L18A)